MKPILTLLTSLLLAPLAALGAEDAPKPAPRPNILWLVAEDMGVELGCYGTPEVGTPHLDRLASDGVRYTRFYATAPMCSPSRSAFQTGMYATSIGAHPQRVAVEDLQPLPPGVRLISEWMRTARSWIQGLGQDGLEFPITHEALRFRRLGRFEAKPALLCAAPFPSHAPALRRARRRTLRSRNRSA
jgi:hypothetical protein